jgi:hypothetical protein
VRVAGIRQERRRSIGKRGQHARQEYCSPRGRRDDECAEEKWVEQAVKVPSVRD